MQCFQKTLMRNIFFEKGQQIKVNCNLLYTLAINKVDTRTYALERVQNPPETYVPQTYSSCIHPYFLHYYTCWAETETITKEKVKEEKRQVQVNKKKSLNMFLSRKGKNQEQLGLKKHTQNEQGNRKQQLEKKQEEKEQVNVIYVQLEAFSLVEPPKSIIEIKIFMGVIYLLASRIHAQMDIWPCMIPVLNAEGKYKFLKRGRSRNEELKKLLFFAMKHAQMGQWSQQMGEAIEMFELNSDLVSLGEKIHEDLDKIIFEKYNLKMKLEGEYQQEIVYFSDLDTLVLQNLGVELPLEQFSVSYAYKSQSAREVTLAHQLFDEVVLVGQKSDFLVKYFKAIKTT